MGERRGRDRPPVEERVCRAIRLLAEGQSARTVAQGVGVLPETLMRWQKGADFRALLACMREHGRLRAALERLNALTPDAIAALQRALEDDDSRIAVSAARDVLDRVGLIRRTEALGADETEQVIRVEYDSPEGTPYSTAPWAARHPGASGPLQSGGVRTPLREDGDGQDPDR